MQFDDFVGLGPGSFRSLVLAASTCIGGTACKKLFDAREFAISKRLSEVQRHALLTAAPGQDLAEAARQLLSSLDWALAVEEQHGSEKSAMAGRVFRDGADDSNRAEVERRVRVNAKDWRRQLRRIWSLCSQQPGRRGARGKPASSSRRAVEKPVAEPSMKDRQREEYEKLFNPKLGSVQVPGDACAALCYLLSAFIELRHNAPGSLSDFDRQSLRLAVAALARHPVFEDDFDDGMESTDAETRGIYEFRRGALLLFGILDAALAWQPVDPLGWFGSCEDSSGALVAQQQHRLSSFSGLATMLRKTLKKAAAGDRVTWRRLEVQLDSVKARELPPDWTAAWLHQKDASMLVRNRTKVPLRVELHRPHAKPSPWADWPLLRLLPDFGRPRPILTAVIPPGIEWALRPKDMDGRLFQMRLITEAGVVVCSKQLRRGQIFDYEVRVPQPGAMRIAPARRTESRQEKDVEVESVASTAAPSSGFPSVNSAASSGWAAAFEAQPLQTRGSAKRKDLLEYSEPGTAPVPSVQGKGASSASSFSAICPRCLGAMHARTTRPAATIYSGGVQCDQCEVELIAPRNKKGHAHECFFHCVKCWYDLCHVCAEREMQEVWWRKD